MGKSGKKQSLLWVVHRKDKSFAGYVLGTMHTRDQRIHTLIPSLEPYMMKCHVLATEFSVHESEDANAPKMAPVEDWMADLTKKQLKALTKLLSKHNLGTPEQYKSIPPLILLQSLVEELLGKESSLPFDIVLALLGEAQGLKTEGVETLKEQLDILEKVPISVQKKQLIQVLTNRKKYKRQVRKQVNWYLKQNIRQLYKVSRKQLGRLRKLLLIDRNKRMSKRMATMFKSDTYFMAIGAAHLWGNQGVLAGLKRKGYKLKPVRISFND